MNVLTTLLCAFAVQAPQVPPPRPLLAVPRTPVPFTAALALPSANPTTAADDVARARDNLARLEPARHSLEARLQALEPGIPAAFQLLQREIGFDSYCGVLRGAQGTYAQRAGNALDRALLLATMLGKQGMVVRFARGRLATARCDQLLLRLFEAVEPTDPNLATASAPLRALLDRVQVRAARDYTALQAALGTSSPALAAIPTQAELRDEVQDHSGSRCSRAIPGSTSTRRSSTWRPGRRPPPSNRPTRRSPRRCTSSCNCASSWKPSSTAPRA